MIKAQAGIVCQYIFVFFSLPAGMKIQENELSNFMFLFIVAA